MIKNKRLENQVMSAKVRGKHSIDLSIGEANQILTEFNRASEECTAPVSYTHLTLPTNREV